MPASAQAAQVAATRACTIVGTPRRDRLVGTPGRDVICGRGGDDVLLGVGNDDVLVGGPGADTLDGGYGRDVLTGEDGRDRLDGGPGADRLTGGDASDVALGGFGEDRLLGGKGDDDLTGGPHRDVIDGGPGTNWCTTDDADVAAACAYDLAPPTADGLTFSADRVDVTTGDRQVTFRVHVSDDTGADGLVVQPSADTPWLPGGRADLVSGTVRDGWWEGSITFRRWSRPGVFTPEVVVWDRINRRAVVALDQVSVDVVDATPDLDVPEVALVTPGPEASFDARTSGVDVPITVHITDRVSGVDGQGLHMVLWEPRHNGSQTRGYGGRLRLQSGTIRDGTWTGTFELPRGSIGGSWQLAFYANDRASEGVRSSRAVYWGPQEYPLQQWNSTEGVNLPFPDGRGSVTVVGRERTDVTAPVVSGVRFSADSIDTLGGDQALQVRARATDDGTGTQGVTVYLVDADSTWAGSGAPSASLALTSGTRADGTWSGTITVPRGYPPGTYYASVTTWDRDQNDAFYLAAAHPYAAFASHVLDTPATVTIGAGAG